MKRSKRAKIERACCFFSPFADASDQPFRVKYGTVDLCDDARYARVDAIE
jgi:hypothetical protein